MKVIFKKLIVAGIAITALLFMCDLALAAGPPGPPGGGGGTPPCWPAPCVPIDGGLSILIAAGLAYGGKKAYNSFKIEE